jgi:hypothetical protein
MLRIFCIKAASLTNAETLKSSPTTLPAIIPIL